jgi:DNA-binding GntR family transcriptional regulator
VIAATTASGILTNSDFRRLEGLLRKLSDAVRRNAYYETSQADLSFHRFIWNASGNSVLARTLDQIATPLFAFSSIVRSKGVQDLKQVTHSHEPIVAALGRRDPDEIRQVFQGHFENSYDAFLNSGFEDCHSFAESLQGKSLKGKRAGKGDSKKRKPRHVSDTQIVS